MCVFVCVCVLYIRVFFVCFLDGSFWVGSLNVEKKSWHFQPVLTEQQFSKCGPGTLGGSRNPFRGFVKSKQFS